MATGRKGAAAVESPDIVGPKKAPLKHIFSGRVLAVQPPGEVQQQLLKTLFEKGQVRPAALRSFGAIQRKNRPGVDRRVHITEVPLVGWQLAVRMQIEAVQHQLQL